MNERLRNMPIGGCLVGFAAALLMILLFPLSAIASEPGKPDDSRAGELSFGHRLLETVEDRKGNTTLIVLIEATNKGPDKFELMRLVMIPGERIEVPDHPRFATPLWIGSLTPGKRTYKWNITLPTSDGLESLIKGPFPIKVEADAGSGKFYYETVSQYRPDGG